MGKKISIIGMIAILSFLLITLPCKSEATPWTCPSDDEINGIYWICNYFPLIPGNQWQYTTGEYHVEDDIHTCSSGYSGILFATDTYEYSSYMQNGVDGLLFAGCQYDEGDFEDLGIQLLFIPPQMQIGETFSQSIQPSDYYDVAFYCDTTLVGLETVTVPAGTFMNTLKIELLVSHWDGSCSYKTTLWLAKGIGPVKIHRTEANPSDCLGCVFVCDPDNDVVRLNTPAELISFEINGLNIGPDLTGTWTSMNQSCKDSKKGVRCKIKSKLMIQNIGNEDALSSIVRIYISGDDTFDIDDALLKQITTGKIRQGKSKTKRFSYTSSYGHSTSGQYIIGVIDGDNTILETNENNNIIIWGPTP